MGCHWLAPVDVWGAFLELRRVWTFADRVARAAPCEGALPASRRGWVSNTNLGSGKFNPSESAMSKISDCGQDGIRRLSAPTGSPFSAGLRGGNAGRVFAATCHCLLDPTIFSRQQVRCGEWLAATRKSAGSGRAPTGSWQTRSCCRRTCRVQRRARSTAAVGWSAPGRGGSGSRE
jgi:hypothetical protein